MIPIPVLVLGASMLLQTASPSAAPPASILGQWESVVRNPGGVGNILEFQPDGRVTQISASMGDTTYELDGDRLRTFYTDESTGEVRVSEVIVEFEGNDRLTEKGESGDEQARSERVGHGVAGASPLVGEWCSLFMDLLTQYRQFTADGKLYVRMPVVTLRGTYRVDGDRLTVEIFGQPTGTYPVRFENGQLFIKGRDGADRVYKRTACTLLKGD